VVDPRNSNQHDNRYIYHYRQQRPDKRLEKITDEMNQKKSKDRFFIDMSGFCHRAFSLKFSRLSTSITLQAIGKEESGQGLNIETRFHREIFHRSETLGCRI
jgi:hypothetical protein